MDWLYFLGIYWHFIEHDYNQYKGNKSKRAKKYSIQKIYNRHVKRSQLVSKEQDKKYTDH